MLGIGMGELFIVLLVALLVFGPERLPDLARSAGRALARFNKTFEDIQREMNEGMKEVTRAAQVNVPRLDQLLDEPEKEIGRNGAGAQPAGGEAYVSAGEGQDEREDFSA
ncbi:MAG: twin-arginine translocase TatA/TatE family subunit [Bacillota bacterium]|jgi:Tat protein translocase TatB subunit